MTITAAALSEWRQWSPKFLNDLILITALVGIAWIDRKTLLIEGRLIALAMGLRLLWLSFFTPQEILNSLTGLLIGAGILYFIGFFYETFLHRQGLGEGDAAVLGLIGLWVGWQGLGAVLLIAALRRNNYWRNFIAQTKKGKSKHSRSAANPNSLCTVSLSWWIDSLFSSGNWIYYDGLWILIIWHSALFLYFFTNQVLNHRTV